MRDTAVEKVLNNIAMQMALEHFSSEIHENRNE